MFLTRGNAIFNHSNYPLRNSDKWQKNTQEVPELQLFLMRGNTIFKQTFRSFKWSDKALSQMTKKWEISELQLFLTRGNTIFNKIFTQKFIPLAVSVLRKSYDLHFGNNWGNILWLHKLFLLLYAFSMVNILPLLWNYGSLTVLPSSILFLNMRKTCFWSHKISTK